MASNKPGLVAGGVALGVTAAVVGTAMVALHRHRSGVRQGQAESQQEGAIPWLDRVDLPADGARVFELQGVDRSTSARVGGAATLRCSDKGTNAPTTGLVDVPGLVLYSIEIVKETILLVFVQVPSVPELFDAPFLDRGVRMFAAIGSEVYVARLDAIERIPGLVPVDKLAPQEQSRYSIVWNTGRCGSTLMHKMLQKVGVLSFSEPFWLDKVFDLPHQGLDGETIARIFGVCAAMDVSLARKTLPAHPPIFGSASTLGSGHVSFNPKGKGFTAMETLMRSLPHVKHMLMYRDVRKVTESFGSIFQENPSLVDKVLGWLIPGRQSSRNRPPPPPPSQKGGRPPTFSRTVAQARLTRQITGPSNSLVRMMTVGWMETICLWKELLQLGIPKGGATATLRMEDFTRKDPELIEKVLLFFLGKDVEVGEETITTALEAFNRHSQAGDVMSKSSHMPGSGKKKFLTPDDLREIEALMKAVPAIGCPDYIFPGSLGAPA